MLAHCCIQYLLQENKWQFQKENTLAIHQDQCININLAVFLQFLSLIWLSCGAYSLGAYSLGASAYFTTFIYCQTLKWFVKKKCYVVRKMPGVLEGHEPSEPLIYFQIYKVQRSLSTKAHSKWLKHLNWETLPDLSNRSF